MEQQNKKEETLGEGCLKSIIFYIILFVLVGLMAECSKKERTAQRIHYTPHISGSGRCDYPWQTAKDGSRCGDRAASRR